MQFNPVYLYNNICNIYKISIISTGGGLVRVPAPVPLHLVRGEEDGGMSGKKNIRACNESPHEGL